MPYEPIPVPEVAFNATDRGSTYMAKLNAIAAAVILAVGGFNAQLAAANDAELYAAQALESKNTATTQASTATTQAGIATTQASTATTQAGIATTQAGVATTQAGISTGKATEAASSAAAALASKNTATTQATTATTKADEAAASAALAQNWASAPENTVVAAGKYSALHYSLKAEYWSQQAAASVTGAMIMVGGYNASANSFPPGAATGYMYRITTAGTLGPFEDGITRPVNVNDYIIKTASSWSFVDAMDQAIDTSRITSGQFSLSRMPRAAAGMFLKTTGTGSDPVYIALAAADIPVLDTSKITTGQFALARMPRAAAGFLRAKGTGSDPAYEALTAADIPVLSQSKINGLETRLVEIEMYALGGTML